jgi:hypothetical protein
MIVWCWYSCIVSIVKEDFGLGVVMMIW